MCIRDREKFAVTVVFSNILTVTGFLAASAASTPSHPVNRKFVAEFEKEYKRLPAMFAAQAFDAALMIDTAVKGLKGKVEDKEALRKALKSAKFDSTHGPFKLNTNQYPIQNYYLRVVGKDAQGRLVNKTLATVFKDHGDAYVQDCPMK